MKFRYVPEHRWLLSVSLSVLALQLTAVWFFTGFFQSAFAAKSAVQPPKEGERLSAYLLRQAPSLDAYSIGLEWRTPQSQHQQKERFKSIYNSLVAGEWAGERLRLTSEQRDAWLDFLNRLEIRGRHPLPSTDARLMALEPSKDPILLASHSVEVPVRPTHVTVFRNHGGACAVGHEPNAAVIDYVLACEGDGALRHEWAYVAQPNGILKKVAIAAWNETFQQPPAAGASIWAPASNLNWPEAFSDQLAELLVHQGIVFSSILERKLLDAVPKEVPRKDAFMRQDIAHTSNNWGGIGLLQMPTARFGLEGRFSLSYNVTHPYERLMIIATPFEWLEGGFGYAYFRHIFALDILDDYKDKAFHFKVRLLPESQFTPQLAVGIRDPGGTGLFGGEYLAASKRWRSVDMTLGLGWGYIGRAGGVANPLGFLGRSKERARSDQGTSGVFDLDGWFSGPAAVFGGVEVQSPWRSLTFKVEWDGNNYRREPGPFTNLGYVDLSGTSRLNLGLAYKPTSFSELSLGIERGDTLTAGFTVFTDLGTLSTPKIHDPTMPKVLPMQSTSALREKGVGSERSDESVFDEIRKRVQEATRWSIGGVVARRDEIVVRVMETPSGTKTAVLQRAMAAVHNHSPSVFRVVTFEFHVRGAPVLSKRFNRLEWVATQTEFLPEFSEQDAGQIQARYKPQASEPPVYWGLASADRLESRRSAWMPHWQIEPNFRPRWNGKEVFFFSEFLLVLDAGWRLPEKFRLDSSIEYRVLDTYLKTGDPHNGSLPKVRSDINEYTTASRMRLAELYGNKTVRIAPGLYGLGYAGILESMFAGAGGELLLRPLSSNFAFGLDWNWVQQRGYKQDFSLRDYTTNTGHASVYWNTPWDGVKTRLSVGKYLAGDLGATIDISKRLSNGVSFGVWASKTNADDSEFGTGEFDKGLHVTIPFDIMTTRSTTGNFNASWRPWRVDAAARLKRPISLYQSTELRGLTGEE